MGRGQSPHFTVYADMSDKDARPHHKLERFDAALRGLFKVQGTDQTTIYFVSGVDDIRKLTGSDLIAGFYNGTVQGALAVVPEKTENWQYALTPMQILFHEYTHHMLLSNERQVYPGWATEGLADLFAEPRFQDDGLDGDRRPGEEPWLCDPQPEPLVGEPPVDERREPAQ
jgi:hypothetical protein